MGMNPTLAAMYNTHGAGAAQQEELAKIAHVELFAKAAAAQGIDLSQLDGNTAQALYAEFTHKLASEEEEEEGPPRAKKDDEEEEGEGEKDAAARAQYAAMAEWQEKNAQADFLGRRMAHSFWQEYNEISKQAAAYKHAEEEGEKPRKKGGTLLGRMGKGALTGAALGTATMGPAGTVGGAIQGAGAGAAYHGIRKGIDKLRGKKDDDDGEKSAAAFELAAAEAGLKIASAAGWNTDEATQRLNAVLTLGPGESTKLAHANGNYEDAINLRGLELLENAGYPVDWNQVLG